MADRNPQSESDGPTPTLRTKADLEKALIAQALTISARDALLKQMAEALEKLTRCHGFACRQDERGGPCTCGKEEGLVALAAYSAMVGEPNASEQKEQTDG
jgi:hypothetical protein